MRKQGSRIRRTSSRRPIRRVWGAGLIGFLCLGAGGPGGRANLGGCTGRVWERYEAPVEGIPLAGNPFDPDGADVRAEFEGPRGRRFEVPAFVFQDFERELVDGREKLTSAGPLEWRVRFTPDRSGLWRWRWSDRTSPTGATSPWRWLWVSKAAPGRHGPLRVSPEDSRYLRHADGAPYFAVGENLCWYDARGTFAYDDWLTKLATQGANYVRLWMPSWAFGLEWIRRDETGAVVESTLGDYTARLDRAWRLDHVMETADRLGIEVMLSIQNHGPFSYTQNSEWADNPYNAANGGPLEGAAAFFTDDEARGLFRRRLRYLAARWSAMSNLLAWELWNEVDLPEQPPQAAVVAWHREMAGELRSHDPMGHLITTSTGGVVGIVDALLGRSLAAPLWELPEIDFTQLHLYAFPGLFPIDFATQMGDFLRPLAPFGKPRLIAEAGVDFRGPAETLAADPTSAGIHDILWSGIFAETFGTGMTWWWDNVVDPEDLYAQFGAVATFVRGVAFDRESFAPGGAHAEAPDHLLQALALRGERTALVWIKNVRHRWFPPETGLDPSPIDGGVLSLDGLADGPWEAQWIDAYDGIPILSASALASDGALTLPIPEFSRDVALRLERQP